MKLKLDENLPSGLVAILNSLGHQTDTVPQEGIAGRDDFVVWEAAQSAGRFLITQDLDFSDIRKFQPGTHHGLLLVRLHDPKRSALIQRIKYIFETQNVQSWSKCFVVVSDQKIRIHRPS